MVLLKIPVLYRLVCDCGISWSYSLYFFGPYLSDGSPKDSSTMQIDWSVIVVYPGNIHFIFGPYLSDGSSKTSNTGQVGL